LPHPRSSCPATSGHRRSRPTATMPPNRASGPPGVRASRLFCSIGILPAMLSCSCVFSLPPKPFSNDRNNHDKMRDFMKLAYILLALALLVPLAFSAPANDGDAHFAGEAIDVSHPSLDHSSDAVSQAHERVFVGSIKSNKYHYPSCQWAKKIKPENEIWFSSSQDARNQGYIACKVCGPP
jgi:hypothetical protein